MAATFSVKTIFSAVDAMTIPLKKMRIGVEGLQKSTKNSLDAIGGKWIERGLMAGAVGMGFLAKSAVETAASFESIKKSIVFASGSQAEGVKNLQFLDDITKNLAIDYTSAAEGFKRFLGATQGQLTGNEQRDVFTGMSKAIRVLGLDSEQTGSVFRALGEVVSKGTLQAQELKVQLANALPGASKAQADALNMSVTELFKNMQSGSIDGLTAVKKLAEYMGNKYAPGVSAALDTASAKMTILGNSWKRILESIGNSIISTGILDYLNEIAGNVLAWASANQEVIKSGIKSFVDGLVGAFKWIVNNWDAIITGLKIWLGLWAGLKVINGLLTIMNGFLATFNILLSPGAPILIGLGLIIAAWTSIYNKNKKAKDELIAYNDILNKNKNKPKKVVESLAREGFNKEYIKKSSDFAYAGTDRYSFVDEYKEYMRRFGSLSNAEQFYKSGDGSKSVSRFVALEDINKAKQFELLMNNAFLNYKNKGTGEFLNPSVQLGEKYNVDNLTIGKIAEYLKGGGGKNFIELRLTADNGTQAEVVNQTGVASVKVTNNIGKGTGGYIMK